MQIKDVLLEQTPPAAQPAAAPVAQPAAQPGVVKNVQQAAAQTKGQQTQGMLNVQALKQLLPGVDGTKLTQAMTAVKSGAMTAAHYQILGMAFQQLVQADSATTVKVMNLLKKVQQEPVAEAGVLDYAKALGQKVTGQLQGQTVGQAATSSAAATQAKTLGDASAKNWANKAALLRQQALKQGGGAAPANPKAPIDPGVYKANLEDYVNRVMFRGDMDALDTASKPQVEKSIDALVAAQGNAGATQKLFGDLALAALTARVNRPGQATAPAGKPAGQQTGQQAGQITPQSVEADLAAQGVKIPGTENAMKSALVSAGIEPRIKATTDPRANALLKRFGYDPR
jgi:hypothetical protein